MHACHSVSVACWSAEKRRRRGEIGSVHIGQYSRVALVTQWASESYSILSMIDEALFINWKKALVTPHKPEPCILTLQSLFYYTSTLFFSARRAMENSKVAIKRLDKPLPVLSLSGIGSFNNSVVFTQLSEGIHLENFKEIVGERIHSFMII